MSNHSGAACHSRTGRAHSATLGQTRELGPRSRGGSDTRLSCAVLRGDRQSQEQQKKAPKRIIHELSLTPLGKGEGDRVIVSGLALPNAGLAAWWTRAVAHATCGSQHDLAYDGPQPAATQTHTEEEGSPGQRSVSRPLQRCKGRPWAPGAPDHFPSSVPTVRHL